MKAAIVALALCALFAVSFAQDAQSAPAEATRFAETEAEDAGVLAEQEQMFEDSLDVDEAEDEDEIQSAQEDESEDQDEVEAEDEDEAEVEDESEDEEETEEDEEAEADEEEAEEDEQEEEAEDEQEDEEGTEEFVLAELQDNPKFTGFMQMTAHFIPTESAEAEHLVHSLSSHQQALAHQQYTAGYAHGMADATAPAPKAQEGEEDEQDSEEEEAEEGEEAAFVEQSGSPRPVYGFPGQFPTIAGYNSGPTGHGFIARPYYTSVAPPPPPVPTWLPPPPYIPPAPAAAGGKDDE